MNFCRYRRMAFRRICSRCQQTRLSRLSPQITLPNCPVTSTHNGSPPSFACRTISVENISPELKFQFVSRRRKRKREVVTRMAQSGGGTGACQLIWMSMETCVARLKVAKEALAKWERSGSFSNRQHFDQIGPCWQCIVGTNFRCYCSHWRKRLFFLRR